MKFLHYQDVYLGACHSRTLVLGGPYHGVVTTTIINKVSDKRFSILETHFIISYKIQQKKKNLVLMFAFK